MGEKKETLSYQDIYDYAQERLRFYTSYCEEQSKGYIPGAEKYTIPNIITRPIDFLRLVKKLKTLGAFAYDTEFTNLRVNHPGESELVGISFSWGRDHTYYVACGHSTDEDQVPVELVIKKLKKIFRDPTIMIIGHNLKIDMHALANYGIEFRYKADIRKLFDTMRACWMCDENTPNGLKDNSEAIVGIKQLEFNQIVNQGVPNDVKKRFGLKANQKATMDMVEIAIAGPYALDDAYATWELYKHYVHELGLQNLTQDFWERDIPYNLGVLYDKEREGVKVDLDRLHVMRKVISIHMDELKYEIYARLGFDDFNMNAPKQMAWVVHEHLGFPILKWTKNDDASVSKDVVEDLCNKYYKSKKMRENQKTLEKIRDWRRLNGLLKFMVSIEENLYADGKIHCNFKQLTVTGRLSCSDVNMQNQPDISKLEKDDLRRTGYEIAKIKDKSLVAELKRLGYTEVVPYNLRVVYVADSDDEVLGTADYSNLELRVLGHFSEDTNLLEAFAAGQDVHSRTALTMFKPVSPVAYLRMDPLLKEFKKKYEDLRQAGKTINFGLIYGMQAPKFAGSISRIWKREVSVAEAEEMYELYFQAMTGVVRWINRTKKDAIRDGVVYTILGRPRRVPGARSWRRWEQERALRQAVNSVIQGSAADIVIVAQLKISKDPLLKLIGFKMLLQVHDEIVFKVKRQYADIAVKRVKQIMENPFSEPLTVALIADPGVASNWADAKAA